MKKFNNPSYGSYVGRMNYGGAKFYRFALFPLMLLMLLFVPTRMVAQTDYDTSVTFSALAGSPEGMSEAENFKKLFDGKKTINDFSKWCCSFYSSAYVIFEASKAGVPVGYTITTGNDNETWGGRNPLSWKLYGNNTGKDDAWELIDEVSDDKVLKDENNTSYDFPCECSTSYQYFKWEISAIHGGDILQVGEFELKLQTCSHKNTDGSDALGKVIETVEPTCTEHGYTTHECSICHLNVKVYKHDVLKPHKLTHHELKAATCTEAGNIEYWQCSVCNKLFSDEATTKEITDAASLVIPAKGHTFDREGNCTVCPYKDSRYALFNLEGITDVTITDNDSYPWKMLDLNADGMSNVSSYFTAESKGLMSNNYGKGHSTSEIIVKFNVEKPILFSFKYLISAKNSNDVFITLNGKLLDEIKGTEQKVYKSILNKGEYTLTLSYNIFDLVGDGNKGADRAFIYDLNTATTISDYVAELDATNTTLTFKKITSDNLESIDLSRLVIVNDEPMVKDMYDIETKNIKNIVFDESFKTYAPTSLEHFFAGCSTLETISGLEYLNTENVTNMYRMFYECNKLSSLDLSKFNTEKVTDMSSMFDGCQKLSSLDLSKFNTEKVTDMRGMFYGCQKLSSLDLSNFNTEKVENMMGMFFSCSALTSLDLSNFNTKKVKHMNSMFESCSALSSLDLSNFNTANVESMGNMFLLAPLSLRSPSLISIQRMWSLWTICSMAAPFSLLSTSLISIQRR
jgi:surface protein